MLKIKGALQKILATNYYKAGDSMTTAFYWDCFGFLTGSSKNLTLYLPVHKSIEFVSGINNITAMTIAIRSITGEYLGGNWYNVIADANCSVSADLSNNVITFQITKSDGWGVTNNTPVTGRLRFNGTFS